MMNKKNNNKNNSIQINRLSGRYEIIEQVGIGGMSYVYKAYDTKKRCIVAIKILREELSIDEEFVNKFNSEALACKDIKHENVISAYDVVDEDNMHYIVMEYVEGKTLNKYIKEKGKLSNEETISISLKIARGLLAAHKKGIIHRDIKPQNIVISDKNNVKITDFGIARAITSTTRNISVVGTVHYISPEQVRNTKVDYRSDIYSFGCTMYEMITGKVPFEGDTPLDIIISHLRNNLKAPHLITPDIFNSLEKIILKAARMLPSERYQTIEELINDLERATIDKDGSYIKENTYDDDDEGKTVIITDEDMKVIKAVSEKFTNKTKYTKPNDILTPEQQAFYDRYIRDGAFKHHMLMKRLVFGSIIAVSILIVIMVFIALDTRKVEKHIENKSEVSIATNSIVKESISKFIKNQDIDTANSILLSYDISLNIVGEEFSDTIESGKIMDIIKDYTETDRVIDVIVSLGSKVLDFSDVKELQKTKWTEMEEKLRKREITGYTLSEINDDIVERGNIIGVNRKNSEEKGDLVFTISKGPASNRDISESNSESNLEYEKQFWHGKLNAKYIVTKSNSPNIDYNENIILKVELVQVSFDGTTYYKDLIDAQEYKVGTVMPIIFADIEGEYGVQKGIVQIVDVENDIVMQTYEVTFNP